MLKVMGCGLIAAGSIGLGMWYRQQYAGRIYHVRQLVAILDMMMSEVRYSKATLPECCNRLADRLEEPYRDTFHNIWEQMSSNTGRTFAGAFSDGMKDCFKQLPLEKDEITLFLEFAGSCGYGDSTMQLVSMERYRERLKQLSEKLQSESAEKGKMAVGLGTLGGLLLIIILW